MFAVVDKIADCIGIIGEIYRLRLPGRTVVVVSTRELVNEACNEKRFRKCINKPLAVSLWRL